MISYKFVLNKYSVEMKGEGHWWIFAIEMALNRSCLKEANALSAGWLVRAKHTLWSLVVAFF